MKIIFSFLFILVLAFTFTACEEKTEVIEESGSEKENVSGNETSGNEEESKKDDKVQEASDEKKEEKNEEKKNKPLQEETKEGIKINFPVGATEVLIKGEIEGAGDNKTYLMDVSKGQKLTGSVKAVSEEGKKQGNIRFAQIVGPSTDGDGPFGPTISYDFTESGMWKLVVSENNMLGEPWKGEFEMSIQIK